MRADEPAFQHLPCVQQEVPPIRDLQGAGHDGLRGPGIAGGSVSCHDLEAGTLPQPGLEGCRAAIGQKVDGPMTLEINDERAPATSPAPSPVVDPDGA